MALAGFIFGTGAIGIDQVISVVERENFLSQGIMVGIEETLELVGTAIAL